MPAPAPPMLQKIVCARASFDEIDQFVAHRSIPPEERSALWLWPRFSPRSA